MVLMRMFRAVLRPGTQETFSQFGEDIHLWPLLAQCPTKFYVDVGCNHPIHFSNTFRLYTEGWRGITIDGNSSLIELHRRFRKQDISLCTIISDSEEDVYFAEMHESCVSSVVDIENLSTIQEAKNVSRIKAKTLNSVLDEHGCPSQFGLLNLDLESYELKVLNGLSLLKYRPYVIAVEIHNLNLSNVQDSECVRILVSHGYRLDSYLNPTAIFRQA